VEKQSRAAWRVRAVLVAIFLFASWTADAQPSAQPAEVGGLAATRIRNLIAAASMEPIDIEILTTSLNTTTASSARATSMPHDGRLRLRLPAAYIMNPRRGDVERTVKRWW
jgi:hypothetical protein